ncbi:MAG: type II toxin-antitoxin system VapC family toxin [Hyphomicrobiales bacterium]|nr:type II toxin-antitoxin system VapC family toxin [Hyphomicrobiales bacterium]
MSEFHLLDTNIISELARRQPEPSVVSYVGALSQIRLSVVVFHELAHGVERVSADLSARASLIEFVGKIRSRFGRDAIPVDLEIAETAGRLRGWSAAKGRVLHMADALIAATAMNYDATLVTRNVKDFSFLSIRVENPFP